VNVTPMFLFGLLNEIGNTTVLERLRRLKML
jgi:hypothetical protein